MPVRVELDFLRSVFQKSRVRTQILSLHDSADSLLDAWLSGIVSLPQTEQKTVKQVFGAVADKTKYRLSTALALQYTLLRLPLLSEKNLLFIGPYLSSPLSAEASLEIGERLGLSPASQRLLGEYYAALPVLTEEDKLFQMLDVFCERVWQTASFAVCDLNAQNALPPHSFSSAQEENGVKETLAAIEAMEQRYAFENELIKAVREGQMHKEKALFSALNGQRFEQRVQDPLRNAKNYCIIMNTLLRKAAEEGGVHPVYIDRASSKIAVKIEQVSDISHIPPLMQETFSSYCQLVRKHATSHLSPLVKSAVLTIDSDVSAELSLGALAKAQRVSPGYLAAVFKRETGKTVSEYVREARIRHAKYLLGTTSLQIQTIGALCGIVDVQYFSKTFKRETGQTPKEYRASLR